MNKKEKGVLWLLFLSMGLLLCMVSIPMTAHAGGRACAIGIYYVTYDSDGELRHAGEIEENNTSFIRQNWSNLTYTGNGNHATAAHYVFSATGQVTALECYGGSEHSRRYLNTEVVPDTSLREGGLDAAAYAILASDLSSDLSAIRAGSYTLKDYTLPNGYVLDDAYYASHDFQAQTTITISQEEADRMVTYLTEPAYDGGTLSKDCYIYVKKTGTVSNYKPEYKLSSIVTGGGTMKVYRTYSFGIQEADTARPGDKIQIQLTSDQFFEIGQIQADGAVITEQEGAYSWYEFTMPANDVTISATFVPQSYTVRVGKERAMMLGLQELPAAFAGKSVTFSSSNTNVATVSAKGVITGVSEGTAIITVAASDGSVHMDFSCTVKPAKNSSATGTTFSDVKTGAYYETAVQWAAASGVTAGAGKGRFGVGDDCTREQIVTFLYKAVGSPEVTDFSKIQNFTDVKKGSYYYDAVAWAVNHNIAAGIDNTHFGVNKTCTRAQAVTFIYGAKGKPAVTSGNSFADVKSTAWYDDPVSWAVANNVTSGISDTQFGPNQNCKREQIVTFIYKAFH